MPSHSHIATSTLTLNSHSHKVFANEALNISSNLLSSNPNRQPAVSGASGLTADQDYNLAGSNLNATLGNTSTETVTGTVTVTNQLSGGNGAHSNIQPSHAAYYIMYIP
jgi:microcystin-dependent protein